MYVHARKGVYKPISNPPSIHASDIDIVHVA